MRPGRQLAVLGLLFAILYTLVFFAGAKGSFSDRLEPRLGLDLIGGTRVTLRATTQNGKPPSEGNLELARQIIENRVNGRGVTEAEVVTEGNSNIVISVAGQSRDELKEVGQPAELRFRKLLQATADSGAQPEATTSPNPSGSPGATPSASPGATPSATASPSASPSATATPAATPSATASASAPPVSQTIEQQREAIQVKVGARAWAAAEALQAPADLTQDRDLAATIEKFRTLTPVEVAALPTNIQFNVPTVTCAMLNGRPAGSIADPKQQAVACEGPTKYLLDVSKVLGTDVDDANAVIEQNTSRWVVSLDFTGAGSDKWTALTREAFNNEGQACSADTVDENGRCRVAVVLDNEVVSSPAIQGVLSGTSQITGDFTRRDADLLASQLRYGALPLTFTPQEAQSVSATLGTEHLKAGLLAAGVGMLLLAIYAFFYYRLLGTVIFLSLILSGLLVFGALILLGRQIGFTLTLAGIAGFIVSLGVAADSFVIYFERLKDEIRDGRTPRSAVPRAWARARRTIISANVISILAAVVLYLVSVGSVRGFAFALGLATVLDLVVVFLFRHPIMTMFANTKAFLSPRVSGLGRVLEREDRPAPATGRVNPKGA
jgi:preprotein translocase subunit SecD